MRASSSILFIIKVPLRGIGFVTRKLADGVARIHVGLAKDLTLGNLDARRDWGHAKGYVRAMHLMLQQERADDYIVAEGETMTIPDLCRTAFEHVGFSYEDYVKAFMRPAEVDVLQGDASKARKVLGWPPTTSFEDMIAEMVNADIVRLKKVSKSPSDNNPLIRIAKQPKPGGKILDSARKAASFSCGVSHKQPKSCVFFPDGH